MVGLVVNPIAGIGGPAGRWGSDGVKAGPDLAASTSVKRTTDALAKIAQARPGSMILTAASSMGADAVSAAELVPRVVYRAEDLVTTAADTTAAVDALVDAGATLVLFAGGDGTAHDVSESPRLRQRDTAVLGIPTGVKMYSSCFATTPTAAGRVAANWLAGGPIATRRAEVLDIDEALLREGRASPELVAVVSVPDVAGRTQARKTPTPTSEADAVERAVDGLIDSLRPGVRYLLGPGGTMTAVMRRLGLTGSTLGVDVLLDGELIALNATEPELRRLVAEGPSQAVVTVIGGQGFLLGRGNQQISAAVVTELSDPPLVVVATEKKLVELGGRPLIVDTGDGAVDRLLAGYVSVITGPRDTSYYRVVAAGANEA